MQVEGLLPWKGHGSKGISEYQAFRCSGSRGVGSFQKSGALTQGCNYEDAHNEDTQFIETAFQA